MHTNKSGVKNRSYFFASSVALVLATILFSATGLRAQEITGRIIGNVVDSSGAAVPNAQISITNQDTGVVRNTVSTSDGLYNDPQVPAGTYTIEVMAPGFSPAQVKNVVVTVGSDTRADLRVAVGSVTQAVTVTEAAPQVNTTSSEVGGTVDEQRVADLPLNGRNWTDLTLLQAGISQLRANSASGGMAGTVYSSMGADIRSNMYLLDGAIMQNLFAINNSSVTGTSLGVDGIREYKVVTNMFGAEYGLMMGSQTTIVSKGGTNAWHGDAFDYLRNSALDAAQFFDNRDTTNALGFGTDKSFVYPDKRIPPFRRNNFGGSFGGPIRKDKTFFYAVYEGLRQEWGQTITTTTLPAACFTPNSTPTNYTLLTTISSTNSACAKGAPAGFSSFPVNQYAHTIETLFPYPNVSGQTFNYSFPFIQPSNENYGQIRLDQNFSAKDTAFVRYTVDIADQTAPLAYPQADDPLHSLSEFLTVSENHILTPTLLNTLRGSFSRTQIIANFAQVPGQTPVPHLDNYWPFPSTIAIGSGVTTWATNTQTTPPPGNVQNIVTGSDDIFWTRGKHAFKFGVLYNHFQDNLNDLLFAGGTYAAGSLYQFLNGGYSSVQFITANSDQNRSWIYHTLGFYAQDDFRVLPRLTLNLGLRYEFNTAPRTISSQTTYATTNPLTATAPFGVPVSSVESNPSLHNFSPRIGLAWDVRGNGKTAIRAGGGIFYDVGLLGGLLTNASFAQAPIVTQDVITNTNPTPTIALLLPFDGMPGEPAAAAAPPSIAPRSLQYFAQQPTLGQWNLTLDQQLPWGMALSTSYVGSKGWHLYQVRDENLVIPAGNVSGIPYNCTPTPTITNGITTGPPPTAANPCTGAFTPNRQNPNLGQFYGEVEGADSWYDALEVVLTKRLSHGLQFQSSYTYERQIDTGQNQQGTDGTQSSQLYGNPDNIDKAVSTYNIPNNWRFNVIYHIPNVKQDSLWASPLHGWWAASIVSVQSGSPFNVVVGSNRSLNSAANVADRPSLDPSFNFNTLFTGNINQWFNPTMFDLQPAGTYGNATRNIGIGPNFRNVDLSLNKDTRLRWLGEGGTLQFRAEFFNILNHPNFSEPNGTLLSLSSATATPGGGQAGTAGIPLNPSAGKITSTVSNSREIQFSLKVIF